MVGEDVALLIIEKAADGLANLVEIAEDIWSAVDVVVSGSNVRNRESRGYSISICTPGFCAAGV